MPVTASCILGEAKRSPATKGTSYGPSLSSIVPFCRPPICSAQHHQHFNNTATLLKGSHGLADNRAGGHTLRSPHGMARCRRGNQQVAGPDRAILRRHLDGNPASECQLGSPVRCGGRAGRAQGDPWVRRNDASDCRAVGCPSKPQRASPRRIDLNHVTRAWLVAR